MFVAPSILEEIVQSPESFAKMVNVKTIVTGGGKYSILSCQIPLTDNDLAGRSSIPRCWRHSVSKSSGGKFNGGYRNRRTP